MHKDKDSYCFDCLEDVSTSDMHDAIQCEECHDDQIEAENNSWDTDED